MATILLVGPRRHVLGGVTSHLDLLSASALARRHQFRHFAVGGEGLSESRLGGLIRVASAPFRFAALLHHSRAALVHLNPSLDKSFWRDAPLLLVARLMGRPVVLQIHGGQLPENFCPHVPGARRLARVVFRLANRLVVLAKVERAAFARIVGDPSVALIPNAIDPAPYAGTKPDTYDGARPLRVIYLGRVVRSKGLFDACEAVAAALRSGVRLTFLVAGDGPDSAALQAHVRALGLAQVIHLLGPLQGLEKARFLLAGDVFLFPTFHPEGLPYALLETMAAATPAVTTAIGAIPDVVTHGVDGLLVAPHDIAACSESLIALARAPERLHALAQAARERVARAYSLSRLESDFESLYEQVLMARHEPVKAAAASSTGDQAG